MYLVSESVKIHKIDKALFSTRCFPYLLKIYNEYFSEEHVNVNIYISRASAYGGDDYSWPMHQDLASFGGKNKKSIKKITLLSHG